MTIPANDHSDVSAVALARDMHVRGIPRAGFVQAIDAGSEEMVRLWRRKGLALVSVYRTVRAYRRDALEEFDWLDACSTKQEPESP